MASVELLRVIPSANKYNDCSQSVLRPRDGLAVLRVGVENPNRFAVTTGGWGMSYPKLDGVYIPTTVSSTVTWLHLEDSPDDVPYSFAGGNRRLPCSIKELEPFERSVGTATNSGYHLPPGGSASIVFVVAIPRDFEDRRIGFEMVVTGLRRPDATPPLVMDIPKS